MYVFSQYHPTVQDYRRYFWMQPGKIEHDGEKQGEEKWNVALMSENTVHLLPTATDHFPVFLQYCRHRENSPESNRRL